MPFSNTMSIGQRIRDARKHLHWSQEHLAEVIGSTARSINRWEQDKVIPQPHYREQLCRALHLSALALFGPSADIERTDLSQLPCWNVPYHRNPFFTGRAEVLDALANTLHPENTATQTLALTGLAGMGKTQMALEYIYRSPENYQAIFWVRAETPELLQADMAALAAVLRLPEQDQQLKLAAVQHWLTQHTGWLLVLDNVEQPNVVRELLLQAPAGHVLLTMRSPIIGMLAQHLELEPLGVEEAALLLLRRARHLSPNALLEEAPVPEQALALELAEQLGGLPLALDQAGAYLEETACSLVDYQRRYQTHRADLLHLRGEEAMGHPASVGTTLSLCLEQVERASPAASDLLRLCAFLYPDAIPEEMIMAGVAEELDPVLAPVAADPLAFDLAIKELRRFSLLQRNARTKTLTVHRLVQAVMQARMGPEQQRIWVQRATQMMCAFFEDRRYYLLQHWELFLPQAQWAARVIEHWELSSREAGYLLLLLAHALFLRGEEQQVELIRAQLEALSLRRGYQDLFEAMGLWSYEANVAMEQGRYQEAEHLAQRLVEWGEHLVGPSHIVTVESREDLALALYYQGKYAQAEEMARQAFSLKKQLLAPDDLGMASSLNELAIISYQQERYAQAEALLQEAIAIVETRCGAEHQGPGLALFLANLADVHLAREYYAEAQALYERAIAMRRRLGLSQHVHQALTLLDLASCFSSQGRYAEAAHLTQQALPVLRQSLRPDHPWLALGLNAQAAMLEAQGEEAEAETLYEQALHLLSQTLGDEHPYIAKTLMNLAELARKRKCYKQAASYYQQALAIQRPIVGDDGPSVIHISEKYLALLQTRDQVEEPESRSERSQGLPQIEGSVATPDQSANLGS